MKNKVQWTFDRLKSENTIDPNFQTHPAVADYMVGLIPPGAKKICEPTPGLGNIVRSLEAKGKYQITAPADFFKMKENQFDCIVMNPPFGSKWTFGVPDEVAASGLKMGYYFLTECMKMTDNVIALMPWFTISDSDTRLKHLQGYGIKAITTLPRKTFKYARIQTIVLELKRGYKGKSEFKIFNF